MLKKIIISCLITIFLITVSIFFSFVYFEHAQQFIIKELNLKQALNKKLEIYISNKLNDKSLQIDIGEIDFLEPEWPNLLRFELNDISINTNDQKENSNINATKFSPCALIFLYKSNPSRSVDSGNKIIQ